ncbi:response regulator transcription factor [Rhodonellum sp.]|uniref:response regulator n=1 Tax=Rhodonellum sp. TaxID=2231180 RepID=UPI002716F77A|nr:response regulator transcription factor [Rhodonellum sp.]MDO9552316.1 response regulator transcription factor [Rhodonellum sp.]
MDQTIIIADDHPLLLKGLKEFLNENGMNIIAEAPNGVQAMHLIETLKPDLAILDLEMPGMTGLEIAKHCQNKKLDTSIILLTLHKEVYIFHEAKNLNISGYLLKEFATEELLNCIQKVLSGQSYFSKKLLMNDAEDRNRLTGNLTPSEIKILRLIAMGSSTKEIAEKLFIAERTVDKHRSNIINKLQLDKKHNALLIWAQKNKKIIF